MPIILKKRLSHCFSEKLVTLTGFVLSCAQVMTDNLSSTMEINQNFPTFQYGKYIVPPAGSAEAAVYNQNMAESFKRIKLISEKGYLSYRFTKEFDCHLAKKLPFVWESGSMTPQLSETEQTSLETSHVENESESESQTVDQNANLDTNFLATQPNSLRAPVSGAILLSESKPLEKEEKPSIFSEDDLFLFYYYRLNQLILNFPELVLTLDGALDEERRAAEQRLILLEDYLKEKCFERIEQAKEQLAGNSNIDREQLLPFTTLVVEMQQKTRYLRLALATSILLAIASSVSLYCVAWSVFGALGISVALMPYIVIPLVIIAGIGGVFLIYNTLADIIIENKWPTFHAIWDWFSRKTNESKLRYVLRVIFASLAIIISLIAVVTSGYTLYAQILPVLGSAAAVIVALPCAFSELIFIMKNSLESINMLAKSGQCEFWAPIKKAYQTLKEQLASENILQWALYLLRLPLQLALFTFKLVTFLVHVAVTAIASDRCFGMPNWTAALISGISELLTDLFPLFGQNDEAGHDHDHGGGIFGVIQKILFFIPALLLGCLNYLFSQFNRLSSNPKKECLSFKEAIKQELISFDIMHSHKEEDEKSKQIAEEMLLNVYNLLRSTPESNLVESTSSDTPRTQYEEPALLPTSCNSKKSLKDGESKLNSSSNDEIATLPAQVIQWRLKKILNQEIKRLESKKSECAKEKIDFFHAKLLVIEDEKTNDSDKVKAMKNPGLCLAKHRSFFHLPYKKTTSAKKWHEMQELCKGSSYDSTSFRCAV